MDTRMRIQCFRYRGDDHFLLKFTHGSETGEYSEMQCRLSRGSVKEMVDALSASLKDGKGEARIGAGDGKGEHG